MKKNPRFFSSFLNFPPFITCHDHVKLAEYKPSHIESNKNQHAREREGTPGSSYERTTREQEYQEDREARLNRQHLRTNHLTPRQRCLPLLVMYIFRLRENSCSIFLANLTLPLALLHLVFPMACSFEAFLDPVKIYNLQFMCDQEIQRALPVITMMGS